MRLTDLWLLKILPIAGAIPFMTGALLLLANVTVLPILGTVQTATLTYGLAIISFMAGVHWGQYLAGATDRQEILFFSNLVTVLAWIGYLVLTAPHFAILLIALFAALLFVDRKLNLHGAINKDYFATRAIVTFLVATALAIVATA